MIPSKELFELIKSMTKTEKRYFKKYASLFTVGDKNNYVVIFDAIDKQKEYDEKKLLEKLKEHDFVKHFAVVKNYLYTRILDALENYHSNMSIQAQMRKTISHIEILQKRGLYNHSLKLIKKVKQEAEESELNNVLLEMYTQWEFGFYLEKYDLDAMEKLYGTISNISESITEISLCRYLCLKMVNFYVGYTSSRDKKILQQAEKLIKSPMFKIASGTKTNAGRRNIYELYFFYWYTKGNIEKAYNSGVKLAETYEANMPLMVKNISSYASTLNNLYTLAMDLKKIDEAKSSLDKIKSVSIHFKTYAQKAKHFFIYNTNFLHYSYRTHQFATLEKQLPLIVKEYSQFEKEFNNYENIEFLAVTAIASYYTGNLKRAIQILNKLRNEYNLADNPEIQSFCNLFYIVVQYDAGNNDILPYLIQSYYRYLRKKSHISKLESAIIALLRKLSVVYSEKQLKQELKKFKADVESIGSDQFDNYIIKYFDFVEWLESKIEGVAFIKVLNRTAE